MLVAVASPTGLVAYLALFAAVGILFMLVHLLVGRLVRPRHATAGKLQIYECGEPTIGSAFVQFDLRFYVIALVFIVFGVEVAFFFPWAVVFGKANHLASRPMNSQLVQQESGQIALTPVAESLYRELGVASPTVPTEVPESLARSVDAGQPAAARSAEIMQQGGRQLAMMTLIDIGIFFAVLLVGFAYVWHRGDLEWVRSHAAQAGTTASPGASTTPPEAALEEAAVDLE